MKKAELPTVASTSSTTIISIAATTKIATTTTASAASSFIALFSDRDLDVAAFKLDSIELAYSFTGFFWGCILYKPKPS